MVRCRTAVLTRGEDPVKKGEQPKRASLTIFTLDREEPLAEIELDQATGLALSPDEKWLYVLDPGRSSKKPAEERPGVVHIVDFEAAKIAAAHEVCHFLRGLRSDRELIVTRFFPSA